MASAVLRPLARAARSFAPRYTQMRYGTRSFFPGPKEGPPHLPARLMLHAVFGASETACTVPQLRVAWDRNCVYRTPVACSVRRDSAPEPSVYPIRFFALLPAAHVAALREPNRSSVNHASDTRARTQRSPTLLPCLPRPQLTSPPCVSQTPSHVRRASEVCARTPRLPLPLLCLYRNQVTLPLCVSQTYHPRCRPAHVRTAASQSPRVSRITHSSQRPA